MSEYDRDWERQRALMAELFAIAAKHRENVFIRFTGGPYGNVSIKSKKPVPAPPKKREARK